MFVIANSDEIFFIVLMVIFNAVLARSLLQYNALLKVNFFCEEKIS